MDEQIMIGYSAYVTLRIYKNEPHQNLSQEQVLSLHSEEYHLVMNIIKKVECDTENIFIREAEQIMYQDPII